MSMKKSGDTIGNRTRDLPVCNAVPQSLRHRVPPGTSVKYEVKQWGYKITTKITVTIQCFYNVNINYGNNNTNNKSLLMAAGNVHIQAFF
jgi:hypothetical protein